MPAQLTAFAHVVADQRRLPRFVSQHRGDHSTRDQEERRWRPAAREQSFQHEDDLSAELRGGSNMNEVA